MTPTIIVHGGAWEWDDANDPAICSGLQEAVAVGYDILKAGGSALDAVEQAVIVLEDNPLYEAGTGGCLNQDGDLELDALFIDGARHDFGAVGGVKRVKNPITLARKIMEQTEHCFFVGAGADRVAAQLGIPLVDNALMITDQARADHAAQRRDQPSDTVGAVAIDALGNMAAATSTSGTAHKLAGRIGDSPLFGSGGYAQNGVGTAGATGKGENIMRVLLSKYVCDQMAVGLNAQAAANKAMSYIDNIFSDSMAGLIVIDKDGSIGAAHTTPKLAVGWVDAAGNICSAVNAEKIIRSKL